ncbi:MAG TPA: acyl-CoA dehydrogenase family protein [Acidimicrobiales bacterium]|nr:acyl-CoA dehydrogenase family protein [Acidimicrobiales bacterium]
MLPDGTRNPMHLQRLKDKLGNRSNASAEVEYDGATAWLVGEEGRGVRTIMDMVNGTRLDAMTGSASGMRWGAVQAVHHATHRRAFGAALVDQPLMANVLADLVVESEAAAALCLRLAGATDRAVAGDDAEAAFRRIGLAAGKYWICKRAPVHAAEALECLGGNGYVEESQLPRLYREAPVNSIWEGSGNVAALDALRAMATRPESVEAYLAEVDRAAGADARLDRAVARLRRDLADIGCRCRRRCPCRCRRRCRRVPGPPAGGGPGPGVAGVPPGPPRPPRGGRRLLRFPAGRRPGNGVRHPAHRGGPGRRHRPCRARAVASAGLWYPCRTRAVAPVLWERPVLAPCRLWRGGPAWEGWGNVFFRPPQKAADQGKHGRMGEKVRVADQAVSQFCKRWNGVDARRPPLRGCRRGRAVPRSGAAAVAPGGQQGPQGGDQ